ncbi:photosynthetic reaction center subunit H [Chelativorans sp. ZYF759]|uniref:photosynthetic reaction center subunit H n=1 Tax=Chelativorans sp. ZYF759 TaxID=2692213 RepID=UPI00145EB702|nr:photosynthetic reaction center subunit H [Chelativorans sp. ZYF759]NMG40340.1 photosynthetic reaction center subunit H [Chelativorans sp. ZYF759]
MYPVEFSNYLDLAQVLLYVFWFFLAGLIFWLRREDRREGYPLESDPTGEVRGIDPIFMAPPKTFLLRDGTTKTVPHDERDMRAVAATRLGAWPGAPITPTGDPLVDGVGPAAWAERRDVADTTWDNRDRIVPSRVDGHYHVASGDPDPRGMTVFAADGEPAGIVTDIWVDRAEHCIRYLEVDPGPGRGPLLVPMTLARIVGSDFKEPSVKVKSITAAQFANVPRTKSADQVTFLEEDRICAYFAGGHLYATRQRTEPIF